MSEQATDEIDWLRAGVVAELTGEGAAAVVLVGSHARGTATLHSDVDVYAIGEGREYELRRRDGWLVSVSWRTEEAVRASFRKPATCALAVPAWRDAVVWFERDGVAEGLMDEARRWRWEDVEGADAWCVEEFAGYEEEVGKLRGALERGDEMSAALWRNVLAMRMAPILRVRLRLLQEREEEAWPSVAAALGEEWKAAQRAALGLDGAGFETSCLAALSLWEMTKRELNLT